MRTPRIGDKINAIGIPQLSGVELTIKSTLLGTVFARQKYKHQDIELEEDQFTYLEPEKMSAAEKAEIIKRLVKPDFIPDLLSFRKEQGIFNRLFEKYPDTSFWKSFDPGFQVKSGSWWLGGGSDQLRIKFTQYSLDKGQATCDTKPITLREEKIGTDLPISRQPKNLLDILN